jgi:hypothetical protein
MDKYEFVHVLNLEITSLKCSQNANNKKDTICFDLASWDAKNVMCYQCNNWELTQLSASPRQCTLAIFCINEISIIGCNHNQMSQKTCHVTAKIQ